MLILSLVDAKLKHLTQKKAYEQCKINALITIDGRYSMFALAKSRNYTPGIIHMISSFTTTN